MFLVTEVGRHVYRPYIYANNIFDFWIADTIGNFTGTVAIIFFEFSLLNPPRRFARLLPLFVSLSLIVYELAQYYSPRSVLDRKDMIATLVAGGLSYVLYEVISRRLGDTVSTQRAAEQLAEADPTGWAFVDACSACWLDIE